MKEESTAVLLRIFIGENDRHGGQHLYEYAAQFLRNHHYAGVTILRGIEGFGHASILHKADILDLSSDLPIVVEVVDTEEKIRALKETIDRENWIESGLVTEEKVTIVRYGKNRAPKD
jgi:PII-like signaling protein